MHTAARATPDPFYLQRFVDAQCAVFEDVLGELAQGRKRTHWMWFVFPQLAALGKSPAAKRYGISSRAEARAYLDHPVLGGSLRTCCRTLLDVEGQSAHAIFGSPDDLKLRSSLTLFRLADPDEVLFSQCLAKFYAGQEDERTLSLCQA